jgi:hypothetical protein
MYKIRLALLSILVAGMAHAGDGVLEIDQACVSGGCFPGDGPGLPVEITKQGSYVLTSNLLGSNGTTAISIQTDGATLDLAGFTVGPCVNVLAVCPVINIQNGIDGASANDVTVRNGVVEDFRASGVVLGQRALVEDLVIRTNEGAGLVVLQNSIVRNNRIANNLGTGASLGAGTAWGGNVLTNNSPDASGNAVATAVNVCTGDPCNPESERRYYLSSLGEPQANADLSCGPGYRPARSLELEDPSNLVYTETAEAYPVSLATNGILNVGGWVDADVGLCTTWAWYTDGGWQKTPNVSCGLAISTWCIEE